MNMAWMSFAGVYDWLVSRTDYAMGYHHLVLCWKLQGVNPMAIPNAANQNADNQYCYQRDTGKGQKRTTSPEQGARTIRAN